MVCYHGSKTRGIKTLRLFSSPHSNLQDSCIYLSSGEAVAALYIWNKPYKWLTYDLDSDGTPVYTESFKDSLRYFYEGVSGFIYTCRGDFEQVETVGIRCAYISRQPVEISSAVETDDAYSLI